VRGPSAPFADRPEILRPLVPCIQKRFDRLARHAGDYNILPAHRHVICTPKKSACFLQKNVRVCARARARVYLLMYDVYACMYVYSRARAREYVCK